jgi:hypothetical protein
MTAKYKIGELVHFGSYPCTFKIIKLEAIPNGKWAYRLAMVPPVPKDLIWLPLIIRVKLAFNKDLVLTCRQVQKNRIIKLKQLLK